jgi:hypothetical protein
MPCACGGGAPGRTRVSADSLGIPARSLACHFLSGLPADDCAYHGVHQSEFHVSHQCRPSGKRQALATALFRSRLANGQGISREGRLYPPESSPGGTRRAAGRLGLVERPRVFRNATGTGERSSGSEHRPNLAAGRRTGTHLKRSRRVSGKRDSALRPLFSLHLDD